VKHLNIDIEIPEAYQFLLTEKARYKGAWGGRGAGRTINFARALLIKALEKKRKILACREIQNSIRDSIHATLKEQIEILGLGPYFDVQERGIVCTRTGSEFIFSGLFRNVEKIKSYQSLDIVDIEEAATISEESLTILGPTVRNPDSEIWLRWNPRYVDDLVHQRFVVNPPKDSIIKFTSWRDNPFFPEVLRKEMASDYAYRPTLAKNIWEGSILGQGRKIWSFLPSIHVKNFDMKLIKDKAVFFCGCDPHQHYYSAILWAAVMPKEGGGRTVWIYNEWPKREDVGDFYHEIRKKLLYTGSLSDLTKVVLSNDGTLEWGIKIRKRALDTRFSKGVGSGSYFSGDTQGLVSEWAKPANGGLHWHCPYEKIIDIQRSAITDDLSYNTTLPVGPFNEPNLYVSPVCKNLIMSLMNHRLEEDSESESEKYKDFSDCLRILYASIEGENLKPAQPNYVSHGVVPVYTNQTTNAWLGA
jgi:phage terminase large subunit